MKFNKKAILISVIIGFVVLTLIISGRKKSEKPIAQPPVVIPTPVVLDNGSFAIKKSPLGENEKTGNVVKLDIVADSNFKYIVGFDVIIKHDKNAIEVIAAESLLPDFDAYFLEKSDHFIVTGGKKITSNKSLLFNNTAIIRLTIIPKKTGEITLKIVEKQGKEKSQMIDIKSTVLIPKVGEIILK